MKMCKKKGYGRFSNDFSLEKDNWEDINLEPS